MSREQWLRRYKTDPEFRLKRLRKLQASNYRKQGGFPSRWAYEAEIKRAEAEVAEKAEVSS